jgi:hypothetical protein
MEFDCIIPYGPNDWNIINSCIEYTRKNVINLRNIYVISYDKNFYHPLAITISEDLFPFCKTDILNIINDKNRSGWYLQQLIKLYSHTIIKDLSEYFLIIDSDVIFLKPTTFFEDNLPLYNYSYENHSFYFEHMNKLHFSLKKVSNLSGICHHIIFKQEYLNTLFKLIEDFHNKIFWKVFLEKLKDINHSSGASEYEMYFNYLHIYYPKSFKIRHLKYTDDCKIDLRNVKDNHYVANHHYLKY